MKNLPVGKKLFVGFGIVIVLIAIILGVTVWTSLDRNNQLDRINAMSDLQRAANDVLDDVNNARIDLRTVFTSSHAEDEYANAISRLNEAVTGVESLKDISNNRLDGYAADANAELERLLPEVITYVDYVHQNDLEVNDAIDLAVSSGTTMAESSTELYHLMLTMLKAEEDPNTSLLALDRAFMPAQQISEQVDNFRIHARDLLLSQDTSVSPALQSELDAITAACESLMANLTTADGRAALQEVIDNVATYKTEIDHITELIDSSTEYTVQARAYLDEMTGVVEGGVTAIDEEVNTLIDGLTTTSMSVMIILTIVVLVAIVISVLVAVYLTRIITRPLNLMHEALVQAGETGNLSFTEEFVGQVKKAAESKDEIGQSLGSFAQMMDRMIYIGDNLTMVANRDLTADISLLGPTDTMGNALKNMSDNLNEMFAEINSVASQVSTAAGEIAQGAQSLAQGSTEQASTVEEISASINEINEQANVSSETASGAATQGNEITRIAQEGSNKMGQMMQAVQEINDASAAIGQVIKVIDDIAFQTNILALNAAVEAARAGEHGKGFAVVADEVRNLAGKSADAAKETSVLISANIEKAEGGMAMSQDTAESLNQIIEGISSTSVALQTLAEQSQASKAATAQVNLAVDQVAQVVQQNSATSEESAAASEEMSSQAQVLQQLIARFKLKGVGASVSQGVPQLQAASGSDVVMGGGAEDIIF